MNLVTENAFAAWLQTVLPDVTVHTGQSSRVVPGDATIAIVSCDDSECPVAGLFLATVRIIVTTPSARPEALEEHRAIVDQVRAAMAASPIEGIVDFFDSGVAIYRGLKLRAVQENREDGRWTTAFNIVAGVQAA